MGLGIFLSQEKKEGNFYYFYFYPVKGKRRVKEEGSKVRE